MRIIHIGLPKTASTFLQLQFFPDLAEKLSLSYNPKFVLEIRRFFELYDDVNLENEIKDKLCNEKNYLISWESILPWNPEHWSSGIDRLAAITPKDAIILIAVRDPIDWVVSLYKQQLQELNILEPQDFFYAVAIILNINRFFPRKDFKL